MAARVVTTTRRTSGRSVRVSQGEERGLAAISAHNTPRGHTTMSGEKINGTPPSRVDAGAVPGAQPEDEHERILGEISHELGNFFHKLYYWTEFLEEKRAEVADGTAVQMLGRTIRSLEQFLRTSLDYFHPVDLACVPMPARDVLGALVGPLRAQLNGTPVTVADDTDVTSAILVDPSRLSQAWRILTRELLRRIGAESSVRIEVGRATCGSRPGIRIGFAVERAGDVIPVLDTAMDGVEWAFAERIVTLHGGEIIRAADDLALVLPVQS